MRTAFVTSSVSRDAGGLFFAMTSLAKSLHRSEVDLSTHGVLDVHATEDAHHWQPVPCIAHSRCGPSSLAYAPNMASALEAGGFDLLHTHGIWQAPSAAVHRWHKKTGKPYLISPHGMLDPWAVAQSRWKKRMVSALYESAHLRDAECIHALCQSEADSIRAYGLKNPIAIIPNGVDLPEADLESGKRKAESGKKTLLFLGRLHPKKGLVPALRAWHALRTTDNGQRTTENWQFVIAGWDQGGHEAELKRLCGELGLAWADVPNIEHRTPNVELRSEEKGGSLAHQGHSAPLGKSATVIDTPLQSSLTPFPLLTDHCSLGTPPSVLFLGPAFGDAKDALLRRADAFILPSFSEGLPMSVLEAWSYGLPVLMTEHCNIPEGFAANAAIRIGTDVESITEGMRQILQSTIPDLQSIGRNGRSLVERQFTWPQVAAQMKEVYEWLLGGGERPGCVRQF